MINFKSVSKKYNSNEIISDFNLEIRKGELVVLIGESGSGKTTLLKMINRLIPLSGGDIIVNNESIKSWNPVNLRRKIGYVIQQHGLFPHMTIKENIQVIPKLLKNNENDLDKKTEDLLKVVGLEPTDFMDRYPSELSGGQQQRVGVARALITDPEIILMDEPFSALDPITRTDLQEELINIQTKLKKTIVFVTHDMDEALKLADRICILKDGNILQYDTPESILRNPKGEYVENFIGKGKIWSNPSMIKAMDAAIENPITVGKNRTVLQAMEIIREKKIDGLLVVDQEKTLIGCVALKELRKLDKSSLLLEEVMSFDVPQVHVDSDLVEIVGRFENNPLGYLAVTDSDNKLKGLITKSTLLSLLGSQFIEMEVK